MNRKKPRSYSPRTLEATRLLGAHVRLARRSRRWTVQGLADRLGVTHVTVRKIETGDPTVRLGSAFEAASILGIPLFHEDPAQVTLDLDRTESRLALLPAAVRQSIVIDDDF